MFLYKDLGISEYQAAMVIQEHYKVLRQKNLIPDTIIFTEHNPPVITLGKSADKKNILVQNDQLIEEGIKLYYTNRGGDVTYHGPGQLVIYPIIDLSNHGNNVILYLRGLEKVLISALKKFDVHAYAKEGFTGVWVDNKKIAAIGIAVSKNVTTHGCALNVNPNLEHFSFIIPCGISNYRITSLYSLLDEQIDLCDIKRVIFSSFNDFFSAKI